MIRDKKALKVSLDEILAWDFERVSVTHKDLIERDGKEIVSEIFKRI